MKIKLSVSWWISGAALILAILMDIAGYDAKTIGGAFLAGQIGAYIASLIELGED